MKLTKEHQNLLRAGWRLRINGIHQGEVRADVLSLDSTAAALPDLVVPLVDVQLDIGEASLFLQGQTPPAFWDEWDLTANGTFQRRFGRPRTVHQLMPVRMWLRTGEQLWCLPTMDEERRLDDAWRESTRRANVTVSVYAGASPDGRDRRLRTLNAGAITRFMSWPDCDTLPVPVTALAGV